MDNIKKIKSPELRHKIVRTINRLQSKLPLKKILKYLGLTSSRFASWSKNPLVCLGSPLALCRKRHPNQLTLSEVGKIKKAFSDPFTFHWPASSIAWKLIHDKLVSANVQTIVRYAKLMGLACRSLIHRSRKRGSLTAQAPNQAWHLDATALTTQDNRKGYVQLLIDNFSRKILAWKVSLSVSGLSTTELLKQAFSGLAHVPQTEIALIVDGGPENNNSTVEGFLAGTPIRKLIARVDVSFSNSLIEAVNKILKYRYLFRRPIPDLERLQTIVETSIQDYNDRPHCALNGLTPNQAYHGQTFDKLCYRERILQAGQNRRLVNKASCPPCVPMTSNEEKSAE